MNSALIRKLKALLSSRFPPPATLRLEDSDGVIGMVTSVDFNGMDSFERYDLIHSILEAGLTPEERRQVQIVVGVTPDETEFYEAIPATRPSRSSRKHRR